MTTYSIDKPKVIFSRIMLRFVRFHVVLMRPILCNLWIEKLIWAAKLCCFTREKASRSSRVVIRGLSETFQAHRTIAFQDYANVHTGRICLHDALGSSKERNVFELIWDRISTVFEKQMNTSVKQLSNLRFMRRRCIWERFQRNYGSFK